MSKDPAFLFYHHDFLVGTTFMTHEEVGQYIRILCHMADKGHLSKERMLSVCLASAINKSLLEKFKVDENGDYYNERLDLEVEKRRDFCESRRISGTYEKKRTLSVRNAYAKRMVNRNRDVNRDVNKVKIPNTLKFKRPTIEEVRAYCLETKSTVDPDHFFNNYESQGWIKANNRPILNWKSTIRTWEKREKPGNTEKALNDLRDLWEKMANKSCSNCRGSGAIYAPGSGKYAKCGCVK